VGSKELPIWFTENLKIIATTIANAEGI